MGIRRPSVLSIWITGAFIIIENGVWMHGCDAIRDIEADFDKLLQDSEEVTDKYRDGRKNMAVRGWQCIMRLIAPLL